jgi:hypothetical protein
MSAESDLLERVVAELDRRKGELREVARLSGQSYDTVLRIKNRENDPGYSKVKALASALFPDEFPAPAQPEAAPQGV